MRKRLVWRLAGLVTAAVFTVGAMIDADVARAVPDVPTPLRRATMADMVTGQHVLDFGWFNVMEPGGLGLLQFTFLNHPFSGVKWGNAYSLNISDSQGNYRNLVDYPGSPVELSEAPSIHSAVLDFGWDAEKQAWHVSINDMDTIAELWYSETQPGGAMDTLNWDGSKVFWASSLAAARVDGRIKFPGHTEFTELNNWMGEQERMAGDFQLGPAHVGYDYAQAGNPDGSADQLFVFPMADGKVRGILAHTYADGRADMCEPTSYSQSDFDTISSPADHIGAFEFPRTISAACDDLSISYTVDQPHLFPTNIQFSTTTMSQGHSNVPGSRATIQHARDVGAGYLNGFPLAGFPNQPPSYWN